jgi:anthranilate phosphoribosyltransferase
VSALQPILVELAEGAPLSPEAADAAFNILMDGEAALEEITAFLMALRVRGESVDEIAAGARALRARAIKVEAGDDVIDTCGTGGGWSTFNVSTAAAIVAAGAGAKVAKHGNRTTTRKSGSADVLEALGVNIEATLANVARCIREAGVGFLFARAHHSAMRHVAPARQALGLRTIFNMVGPLSNPAGATRQLLGVYDEALVRPMAEALRKLGAVRAIVVHGADGLDEITTTGPTKIAELADGEITEFEIKPEDAGVARAARTELEGGDPKENAKAIKKMLDGASGPCRDIVALNAGAALTLTDPDLDWKGGVKRALAAIDDGSAKAALKRLVAVSNEKKA